MFTLNVGQIRSFRGCECSRNLIFSNQISVPFACGSKSDTCPIHGHEVLKWEFMGLFVYVHALSVSSLVRVRFLFTWREQGAQVGIHMPFCLCLCSERVVTGTCSIHGHMTWKMCTSGNSCGFLSTSMLWACHHWYMADSWSRAVNELSSASTLFCPFVLPVDMCCLAALC